MLKVNRVFVYLLLSALPVSVHALDASTASQKPNILLLLADDLGYNDSAIYHDVYQQRAVASMPALEAFAATGVRFTRFYTESTCSASRVALLTGQYPARQGFMPVGRGISPDALTLADYLKSQGYRTHHTGKWHVGEVNVEAFPTRQGFDSSFGFLGQWYLRGPDAKGQPRLKPPTYHDPWLYHVVAPDDTYKPVHHKGHLEDLLTQHTVKLIRQETQGHKPWFIYHAFYAPHTPLEPSPAFAAQFPATPEGQYLAMLAQLDDNLAKIFHALKESGQWDNTIIIFASDNGSPEKFAASNAPFEGGKAEYEEGGIRTPFMIKWDATRHAVGSRHDVVSMIDIFPSLVKAITGDSKLASGLDGEALLQGNGVTQRQHPLYFLSFGSLSVLSVDGRWRLFKAWENGAYTDEHLYRYSKDYLPVVHQPGILDRLTGNSARLSQTLFDGFLAWRDRVRLSSLKFVAEGDFRKISGAEFQRAPVNPAFAFAFALNADGTQDKQKLLYQQDVTNVELDRGVLSAKMNGIEVRAQLPDTKGCHVMVLSGEFYDRFSSMREEPRISRLHLIADGVLLASAEGVIHDFSRVDLLKPLQTSASVSGIRVFASQLLPDDKPVPSHIETATDGLCEE